MQTPSNHLHYFKSIPHRPQDRIGHKVKQWATDIAAASELLEYLPSERLDRTCVRVLCQDQSLDVLIGYRAVMAWGSQRRDHGKSAWASRRVFADVLDRLRQRKLSESEAYEFFLNKEILGLGPAYFTKLLYFFSAGDTCFIMDQWTSKSVNLIFEEDKVHISSTGWVTRENTWLHYKSYCDSVRQLSRECEQECELIEQRLFSKGGKNPDPWRRYVKKHWRP
jgi:hypothetical protein